MTAEPAARFYESQGLRLHYVDWGNEAAPPLILVHGGLDHCRNWDAIARELQPHFHVVAPDLRGHGDSEWAKGKQLQPRRSMSTISAGLIRSAGAAGCRPLSVTRWAGWSRWPMPEPIQREVSRLGLLDGIFLAGARRYANSRADVAMDRPARSHRGTRSQHVPDHRGERRSGFRRATSV